MFCCCCCCCCCFFALFILKSVIDIVSNKTPVLSLSLSELEVLGKGNGGCAVKS